MKTPPAVAGEDALALLGSLHEDPENARLHPEASIAALAESLRRFGQPERLVCRRDGTVIAGNGRLQAMQRLGWEHAQVVYVDWDAVQCRVYALTANRTAELSVWDEARYDAQLEELEKQSFDLSGLGFDVASLDDLATDASDSAGDVLDVDALSDGEDVEVLDGPPLAQVGDVWTLGQHRLMCGDSTSPEAVSVLMAGEHAPLVFTSPPYAQQRDYGKKVADWEALMRGVFAAVAGCVTADAQILVNLGMVHRNGEWQAYWDGWMDWMREQGWRRFGWYVWDQGPGLPGDWNGRLAPSHEFIFHFNRVAQRARKWDDRQIHARGTPHAAH